MELEILPSNMETKPSQQGKPFETAAPAIERCNARSQAENPSQPASSARLKARTAANVIALNAALFVSALDDSILSTAAPTISADLHAGAAYSWMNGAYLLASAASIPIIGTISDIWGRRPVILFTVALFFLSSIICALAVNTTMLIVGRSLQGIAGGGILQMVSVITADLFSERYVFLQEFEFHN